MARSPGGISAYLRDLEEFVINRPYSPCLGTMFPGLSDTCCGIALVAALWKGKSLSFHKKHGFHEDGSQKGLSSRAIASSAYLPASCNEKIR
jgi:hypothetical protein